MSLPTTTPAAASTPTAATPVSRFHTAILVYAYRCAVMRNPKCEKCNAHEAHVNSMAYSSNGQNIVSVSDDKTIKVWDAGARIFAILMSAPQLRFLAPEHSDVDLEGGAQKCPQQGY